MDLRQRDLPPKCRFSWQTRGLKTFNSSQSLTFSNNLSPEAKADYVCFKIWDEDKISNATLHWGANKKMALLQIGPLLF